FAAVESQNQSSLVGGSFTTYEARRLLPSYTYSTVNNPYYPTRGQSFTGTFEFTGGFFGGNINFYRPSGEDRYYKPVNRGRNKLAMRVIGGFFPKFSKLRVPFYARFFSGGDFSLSPFHFP